MTETVTWQPQVVSTREWFRGPENPFPPMPDETPQAYAAWLIESGNAKAFERARSEWVWAQYRQQVAERYGAEVADAHMARLEGYARRFLPHLFGEGAAR